MRTQDEIVARMKEIEADKMRSFMNFESEVLLDALDFEHAKPWLKEGTKPEEWSREAECAGYGRKLQFPLVREDDLKAAAADYLKFAWGKAQDHRGISAGRSVDKMTSYCWLLGHDTKAIDDAGYAQYGCPKLKVISELLSIPLPTDPDLVRMMEGEQCTEGGCENGCGQ